jgi:hypothetical protein
MKKEEFRAPNNSLERTPRAGLSIDGSGQAGWGIWVYDGRRAAQLESVRQKHAQDATMDVTCSMRVGLG